MHRLKRVNTTKLVTIVVINHRVQVALVVATVVLEKTLVIMAAKGEVVVHPRVPRVVKDKERCVQD